MRVEDIERFINDAQEYRLSSAFNPYSEICADHDLPDAAAIRSDNLRAILKAACEHQVDELWLGLEPTWRGGRRTGLAMTDEPHLSDHAARWHAHGVRSATRTAPPSEQTAGYVWRSLDGLSQRVFLWNAVPFHTHEEGNYRQDRRHTEQEREACLPLLRSLLALLRPARLIAIGVDAETAFSDLGRACERVRHPSRGGQVQYGTEMANLHPSSS